MKLVLCCSLLRKQTGVHNCNAAVLQDTVKKTKWVLELVQGLIADNDAASEAQQAQHASELVHPPMQLCYCAFLTVAQLSTLLVCLSTGCSQAGDCRFCSGRLGECQFALWHFLT